MTAIKGIAEVVLNARDIEAMSRFYEDTLGFVRFSQSPDIQPTIIFLTIKPLDSALGAAHPQVLALIDPARHAFVKGEFDLVDRRTSTLNHLAFEIDEDDFEPELKRLAGLGIKTKVTSFPHLQAKAIFFRDPEENVLELICHDSTTH